VCFKEYIEGYLNLAVYRYLEKDAKKIAAEDAHCDMLFCRIERALEKESNGNKT